MKAYYLLSGFPEKDKKFFFESIKEVQHPDDFDTLIATKFYRVNQKTVNTTNSSLVLETWLFLKSIWQLYNIAPSEITWIYKNNLTIVNDDLWMYHASTDTWEQMS